jgi:hypothetical protein
MKFENIWKSPISTIISVAMLIYTFYLIHVGKTTVTEALPLISFALYGLGKKDPLNPDDQITGLFLILVTSIAMVTSCKSFKTVSKEIHRDSVSVSVKDRKMPVKVEGARVQFDALLKCDSLGNVKWNEGWRAAFDQLQDPNWNFENSYKKAPDPVDKNTVTVRNKNGATATLRLDTATGKLSVTAGCDSLLREVTAKDSVIKNYQFREMITQKEIKVPITPWWNYLIIGVLLAVFFSLVFVNFLRSDNGTAG